MKTNRIQIRRNGMIYTACGDNMSTCYKWPAGNKSMRQRIKKAEFMAVYDDHDNKIARIYDIIPTEDNLKNLNDGDTVYVLGDSTDAYTKIGSGIYKGMFESHLYCGDIYSAAALAEQMNGVLCKVIRSEKSQADAEMEQWLDRIYEEDDRCFAR